MLHYKMCIYYYHYIYFSQVRSTIDFLSHCIFKRGAEHLNGLRFLDLCVDLILLNTQNTLVS